MRNHEFTRITRIYFIFGMILLLGGFGNYTFGCCQMICPPCQMPNMSCTACQPPFGIPCPGGCCPFGTTCCGSGCCQPGLTCCGGSTCCLSSETCCGDHCCTAGYTCCASGCCDPSQCQTCVGGQCVTCGGDPNMACCDGQCYTLGTQRCCGNQIYDEGDCMGCVANNWVYMCSGANEKCCTATNTCTIKCKIVEGTDCDHTDTDNCACALPGGLCAPVTKTEYSGVTEKICNPRGCEGDCHDDTTWCSKTYQCEISEISTPEAICTTLTGGPGGYPIPGLIYHCFYIDPAPNPCYHCGQGAAVIDHTDVENDSCS